MPAKPYSLQFPSGGLNRRYAYQTQPPYTSPDLLNVRPFGASGRQRGGSRPSFQKAYTLQLGTGGDPIRMLSSVRFLSSDTLIDRVVASSDGKLYRENPAGTLVEIVNYGGLSLSATQQIQSIDFAQKVYIADWDPNATTSAGARKPKIYNPATDTLAAWTAEAGMLPVGCPVMALYHNRIVLAGAYSDPQNWYMSAVDDPLDWDYSVEGSASAIAGNNSDAGKLGEQVTCLAPHSNNCMLMGGPTSMWMMRGDPGFGGSIHCLDTNIGIVGRQAWCHAPANADGSGPRVFVFMSQDGIYVVPAGCEASSGAQSLSRERLPSELLGIDPATTEVSLAYDVLARGVHVFVTGKDVMAGSGFHWFIDWTTKGFFPVQLGTGQSAMDPLCLLTTRNQPFAGTSVLAGCQDGYVRCFINSQTAPFDASTSTDVRFDSYAVIGPIPAGSAGMVEGTLSRLQTEVYSDQSNRIRFDVAGAWNARDITFNSKYNFTVTGSSEQPIVSPVFHPRVRGTDFGIKLSSDLDFAADGCWELERLFIEIEGHGRRRY